MSGDFAKVYEEQVWNVYGFFAYRVRNQHDAEDLTQQTFERALRARPPFDPERGSLAVWLLAIARNLLVDHYRSDASGRLEPLEAIESELLGTEPSEPNLGLDPELGEALATLSPRDREILALRFGGDLTGQQIAALTGLTLANVQQILSRSLRNLRAKLAPRSAHASATTVGEEVRFLDSAPEAQESEAGE